MTSGSTGPHRAFMGVTVTVCVCLMLTLVVGWRWYVDSVTAREMMLARARLHETRIREMEKLGLDAEAGIVSETPDAAPAPSVSIGEMTPASKQTSISNDVVPPDSQFKELPLQDTAADYVDAFALLQTYWKATSTKERIPLVFDAPRVSPLMQAYYDEARETDPDHTSLQGKSRFILDGHEILYFSYASSRATGLVEVAMRRGSSGNFLIDWESLAGHSDLSFTKIRETKPTSAIQIRAFVKLFEYYNYEFTSAEKFVCIKMMAVNGVDTLYGYAERESELGRWLVSHLQGTANSNAMSGYTMRVSFPENAQSDQCMWINQIIAPRWLLLNQ